ncbi:unnamed protein product [Paramecium sonneborni]|uniref:YTH domain-containing protein n=1 Tax=Paramecium sonneborni TaxID=65129 RepID=A0A8S1KYE6_9CILI|nr:unnamed protein product [Paramecium sonneborni]
MNNQQEPYVRNKRDLKVPYISCQDYTNLEQASKLIPALKQINQSERHLADAVNAYTYIIRSNNDDDIHKSIKYGIWTSSKENNEKLNTKYIEAQQEGIPIYLFFSVVRSGQFVGVQEKHQNFWKEKQKKKMLRFKLYRLIQLKSKNIQIFLKKMEANCEGQQQIQKQCKEWEKKYFECNSQLKENKKYAQKLQELNQQLLHKLKQFEFNTELNQQKNVNNEIYEANTNVLIKYEQIIKTQQEQIQQQEDRYIALESKYDKLKENSEQFLFNSRDLKYQYEHMLNTLESIANSY